MLQIITSDLDEATSAVSRVYCPHRLQPDRRTKDLTARLRSVGDELPHVDLEYGAKLEVDAGSLDGLTLVMHSVRGSGTVRQSRFRETWRGGQTVVVSGNRSTIFDFDTMFAQSTLRLVPSEIRRRCELLLGVELNGDVRFALERFSPELESMWSQVLAMSSQRSTLPPGGLGSLRDLAMDLLLYRCPHNYSHLFDAPMRDVPRLAREAMNFLDSAEDYELPTVADLAKNLGVSVRSLERAMQEASGVGPAEYMRALRLDRVRRQLETALKPMSVTDAAAAHGFYHPGRFAKYYRDRFGESPSSTLARSSGGLSHSG